MIDVPSPSSLQPAIHESVAIESYYAPVRIDALGADDDVLGRPDRLEPVLRGGLDRRADAVGARALVDVRQDQAEVHDPIVLESAWPAARVARLATIDPDGRAHLVPIVFVLDGETLYTAVDSKPKRSRRLRRIENARERPDVTVLVDEYEEDWARSGGCGCAAARACSSAGRRPSARSRCSPRSTSSTNASLRASRCSRSTSTNGGPGLLGGLDRTGEGEEA